MYHTIVHLHQLWVVKELEHRMLQNLPRQLRRNMFLVHGEQNNEKSKRRHCYVQ